MKIKSLFSVVLGLALIGSTPLMVEACSNHKSEKKMFTYQRGTVSISASDLVWNAYQGQYTQHGIPSYSVFNQKVRTGQIKAEDLVKAAYYEYRADYKDLFPDSQMIKDVESFLNVYNHSI